MTAYYVSWATGNDTTGDGSYGNPWKTITKGTTSRTGGDEVRVEKSAAPTALTGTLTFTNASATLTGSSTAFSSELAAGDFVEDSNGDWWEVITITNDTTATLYQTWRLATDSGVSSRKLGVTSTGAAASGSTQVQIVSASGTSAASKLKVSGGWDLSAQTQDGQTYFLQMNGTFANRYGYGLYSSSKSFFEIERVHFLRYSYGIYTYGGNNILLTSVTCNSNGSYGIDCANYCNDNVYTSVTCNGNGVHGLYYYYSNDNVAISPNCSGNAQCGIRFDGSTNSVIRGTLTTSGNNTASMMVNTGQVVIAKASIAESTRVASITASSYTTVSINDIGGQSEIWTDGGNIVSQNATAGGTGKEWRFNVTSDTRTSAYPLVLEVARVACAANAQVTVTLYMKKSHATSIAGRLFCRGLQIAGVDNDVSTTCPSDTTRNNVQIQFTPTAAGVVVIEAEAWWVSATDQNIIIDDIAISQA